MCIFCADQFEPSSEPPADTAEIVSLIEALYAVEPVGGPLHVELDDWNIEDQWWELDERDVSRYAPETMKIARRICDLMKPLMVSDRAAVLVEWRQGA